MIAPVPKDPPRLVEIVIRIEGAMVGKGLIE